jgi:gliding motility-associated-like protein
MRYFVLLPLAFSLAPFAAHAQCTGSIDLGPDVVLCEGQTTLLTPGPGFLSYLWNDGSTVPVLNEGDAGVYSCTVQELSVGSNLVVNGDFSAGANGFTSGYIPGTGGSFGLLSTEGQYAVAGNASDTHTNFPPCTDHTGGGNLMVVNGAATAGVSVWCQSVTVVPGTTYAFSAWLSSMVVSNPAVLQFTINGQVLGNPFTAASTSCTWNQFYEVWNAGINTSAEICITNQNTLLSGNDFALDDITFNPFCTYTDSVTVRVDPYPEPDLGADQVICGVGPVLLDATTPDVDTYTWNSGLATGPQFTVTTSGTYWVNVLNGACFGRDSVTVTFQPQPSVDLGPDLSACTGSPVIITAGQQDASLLWSDGSNGITYTALESEVVWVALTQGPCTASDTVVVSIAPCTAQVEVPNIFTPNGDSVNDQFQPIILEGATDTQLSIYNRWGQLVYASQRPQFAWDGRTGAGNVVADGVYFWVLGYTGPDGPDELHGTVTLLR